MAAGTYTDPISFVRASECATIPKEPRGNASVGATTEHLSGYEVRTFYERTVSEESVSKADVEKVERKNSRDTTPHGNSVQGNVRDLKVQTVKRKDRTPSTQGTPSPSTAQLFLFAQEGMLNDLRKALATSTSSVVDLNMQDMYGWSLLMSSAYAGHHDMVYTPVQLQASS